MERNDQELTLEAEVDDLLEGRERITEDEAIEVLSRHCPWDEMLVFIATCAWIKFERAAR